ncbi:glycoside hydrolase [Streptomyces abyssalis]|uniref:Glycoside hydrolase n=2 Tax=Streptomyces abyssalis TaxID=933944 RepID=A0A1E7JNY4_9ACTN|nr:C40 family peptidase [Streptomyces abyssalis]OEU86620.1 glycoside hydrolase [Streptomyces abyssalis]OEU89992.1 glycoside hydrolase [Streptomyces abyssalis]OEV27304.1 glycoside hydrolase [Streptomyces nanshensis]
MLVAACTLGLLAGPAAGSAYADPADPGDGGMRGLEQVGKEIDRLHEAAESATDAYNGAQERAEKQQKAVDELTEKIDSLREKRGKYTKTAGALARAQYRSGGMPDEAHLILRKTPEAFMHDAVIMRKGQQATKGVITTLAATESRLDEYAAESSKKLRKLEANKKRKAAAKKKIEKDLERAEDLESQLAEKELERLRELEDEAASARQAKWLESGVLDEISGKASKAGKKAIGYATNQIGKDYEWGAEGPRTFDCSGLTLRAWQAAGEEIPRTSQEQWKQLEHVPIRKMRPGDLIIYKRDASHVGMYVGGGEMVHAPRTGRQITVAGAGSLLIKGVVRPDE